MNPESNDFKALRKLMALKRHEQPPPGYFNRLPDKIMTRLELEGSEPTFWERIVAGFSFRPSFAYSFALAAFGALTFSVVSSVKTQPQGLAQTPLLNGWRSGSPAEAMATDYSLEPLHLANWMGNTNPNVVDPVLPSMFDTGIHGKAIPVTYASP